MLHLVPEATLVALVGFAGGLLLGLAARLGRFCTLGAIEDLFYAGSDARARMWVAAIGTAITGAFLSVAAGALDPAATAYLRDWNPFGAIAGGLVFGYGMAIAGNCGYGALARLGGGDLRSFVIVLVMGLAAYATLSGPLAPLRVALFPPIAPGGGGIAGTLGALTGLPPVGWGLAIGVVVLAASVVGAAQARRPAILAWGGLVGLAVTSGWIGTQWIARAGFEALPVESHTFSAPAGEAMLWIMTATGTAPSFGIGSVAGVLVGAFAGSLVNGHFRWEACEDPRELTRQIGGAALMGIGAVTALGCSVGQGLSAFSVLAISAPLTLGAIVAGAVIGLRQLITGFSRI